MQIPALARHAFLAAAAAASLAAACANASPFAYLPSPNRQLTVVDTATNSVVTSLPTGANPRGVAVSPAGHRVYVTNVDDGTVTAVDSLNNRVLATIPVGQGPLGLQVSPDGKTVAVATSGASFAPSHSIALIDVGTSSVSRVQTGAGPSAVAYNRSGSRLYVANFADNTVWVLDQFTASANIGVPPNPMSLATNPAGTRLYVGHVTGGLGAQSQVSVIDTTNNRLIATIPLTGDPEWLAVDPDGSRVYVAVGTSGTIAVIDTATNRQSFEILLDSNSFPSGIAVSDDGATIFVVDSGRGELSTRDANSFQKLSATPVGAGARARGDFLGPQVVNNGAQNPGPLSGMWWNPNESGWGVNFTQRGNNIFAAWFTYDSVGNPKWYSATCVNSSPTACSGTLYVVTGPRFFGVPFDPSKRNTQAVGSISVNFSNNDTGSFSYTVSGLARTVAIQRQPLAGGPAPQINYTDMWFNAAEPGWGIGITQQASTLFAAWYVYDDAGNPRWFEMSCSMNADGDSCTGDVFRHTGPPFGPTFDPSKVQAIPAGRMTLNFPDPNNGEIVYIADTLFVTKKITRQIF